MLVKNLAWEIGNEIDIKVGFFLQSVLMSFEYKDSKYFNYVLIVLI